MLKRIVILVFILSTLVVLAMAPMSVSKETENTGNLQVTVEVTVIVETPVPVGGTPNQVPVTGSGSPMTTLIIFGLIAVLGVAVLIGGAALFSRRQ